MSDTLTDIHDAVGGLMAGIADDPTLADDAALDAELDAKHAEPGDEASETADGAEVVAEPKDAEAVTIEDDEIDPLKDAKPFDYTVDGQAKTYEGIRVLHNADGSVSGAVIQPDAIKDVQYRLQRGEYLEGQNKSLYERTRDFDAITFTDRTTQTEHKGLAAVEQYALENARQHAALTLMAETIENPEKLIALALAHQAGDAAELNRLTREIGLAAKEANWKTREAWGQRMSQAKEQESSTQDRAATTTAAIQGAVSHWAKQFPSLTAEDTQKAVTYFNKIGNHVVRPSTPDEAKAAGVKPGELIIDHPVVHEYLSTLADLRKNIAASTTAASIAAKENAARLANAARGKRPKTPTPAKRQTVPADDGEETWAQQKARLQAGTLTASDD